jgi:hypothetical protein
MEHAKALSRDDLILPIYFVTMPSLEKADLQSVDPIAMELNKRQRYDWRERSELPVSDLSVKKAVRELSEKLHERSRELTRSL